MKNDDNTWYRRRYEGKMGSNKRKILIEVFRVRQRWWWPDFGLFKRTMSSPLYPIFLQFLILIPVYLSLHYGSLFAFHLLGLLFNSYKWSGEHSKRYWDKNSILFSSFITLQCDKIRWKTVQLACYKCFSEFSLLEQIDININPIFLIRICKVFPLIIRDDINIIFIWIFGKIFSHNQSIT